MLVLVLDWTQCLPQGVGAPPAMLRGRTAGFPKKLVAGLPERRGRWLQFAQSPRLWHTNHEQAVSVWFYCVSLSSASLMVLFTYVNEEYWAVTYISSAYMKLRVPS